MSDTETMFTVTFTYEPTAWGEKLTARLLNPDGSTCVERSWESGPDGMTGEAETDVAEWVGDEAQEFINTAFDAAWEQHNTQKINRP